ncbi:MAG: DUF2628 domain-containing protein [Oscillospiraceae bacterium]|nr:DUF2628 domain-containing protein [Oscillospiraceae bacterium]
MFFHEGEQCPVCGAAFTATDDIVTCPACGAPHHRACWGREGHCRFDADHGTPRQWKRADIPPPAPVRGEGDNICPHCGAANVGFAEFCSECGRELPHHDWSADRTAPPHPPSPPIYPPVPPAPSFSPFGYQPPFVDPFGGVPHDAVIDGVSAADMAAYIGPGTAYYLPRFHKMINGASHAQWNWAAFLLTPYWLFYRKNFAAAVPVLVFYVFQAAMQGLIWIQLQINGTTDIYTQLLSALQTPGKALYIYMVLCLLFIDLVLRIAFGCFGTALYMRTGTKRVKRLAVRDPKGYAAQLPRVGGISFLLGASAFALLQFVSLLFSAFLP